ncbi:MAG TPA: AarF/ABC1/UbiB kinase family protein, partial [Acidimicrobiales bacterium]|nr:AarF/ABC1/UbiB kinase family protein [Acidimicrobiales bacterium]
MVASPSHVHRYAELARLLVRHRSAFEAVAGGAPPVVDKETRRDAERLASDLEAMGPTFVKLGQLLSTRSDLLPAPHLVALARLQDQVAPFGDEEAREVFRQEIGATVEDAFRTFDDQPLASASLGQVHAAELANGHRVVVKIQRPDVADQVASDLEALGEIARLIDAHTDAGRRYGFEDLLDQFRRSVVDELDYRREAANLLQVADIAGPHPLIVVPRPVQALTAARVLTMDRIDGRKVTELGRFGLLDVDGAALADALFAVYLDQIFVHGFFHADPHPGNVLVTDDGRLALVDLGMVGMLRTEVRTQLIKLVLALAEGRADDVAGVLVQLGTPLEDFA